MTSLILFDRIALLNYIFFGFFGIFAFTYIHLEIHNMIKDTPQKNSVIIEDKLIKLNYH